MNTFKRIVFCNWSIDPVKNTKMKTRFRDVKSVMTLNLVFHCYFGDI